MIQTEKEAFWYLPENLTEPQKQGLELFKEKLIASKDLLTGHDDDPTLLRFLKARQWNIEPALLMYRTMVHWRTEHEVDETYRTLDFPELKNLVEHYPHFYHKTDKYGRPVYIELLGQIDCTKMLQVAPQERIINYHIWTWERLERVLMPSCSVVEGKPIVTCTVILDMAGLSMKNFTLTTKRLLTAITKIDQDYYPEHLGTMFIINTPYIFTAIWAVVNPMLEERTRKKIMVLGANYLDTVKHLIPLENLPTIFGGTSVCKNHLDSVGPWNQAEPCKSTSWFPLGQPVKAPVDIIGSTSTASDASLVSSSIGKEVLVEAVTA